MSTFQDMHHARQKETFVGREGESFEFRENLLAPADDPGRSPILSIFGQGGMGKSTFLKHCREIAKAAGTQTGLTDESDDDLLKVMEALSRTLDQGSFNEFTERAETYRRIRREFESHSDAPPDLTRVVAANLGEIGTKLARRIPVAGVAFDFVDEEKLGAQLTEVMAYVMRKSKKAEDAELLLDPIGSMSPLFAKGLAKALGDGNVALCFDTYEETSTNIQPWLLALLNGKYGTFPRNLYVVIAGRDGLDANTWGDFDSLITKVEMHPLSHDEATSYLASKNITGDSQVKAIVEESRGVPLFLAILAMGGQNSVAANEGVVDRILRMAPSAFREAAISGAIPRVLNDDIGKLLFGEERCEAVLAWLISTPFVRPAANGWRYHDLIRSEFLQFGRRKSPAGWREAHGELAEYHKSQEKLLNKAGDRAAGRREAVEAAYHLLMVRQSEGLAQATAAASNAWIVAPSVARPWVQAMRAAGRDSQWPAMSTWGDDWTAAIDGALHNDDGPAVALFGRILGDERLSSQHAVAYLCRSTLYRRQGRYDMALSDVSRAETLDVENTDVDNSYYGYQKALIHLRGRDPETALRICEEAIAAVDGESLRRVQLLLLLRVRILRVLFSGEVALQVVEELADVELPARYVLRGELLRETGQFALAIADLQTAMEMDPSRRHSVWKEIARSRLGEENEVEAVDAIEEALAAAPNCGHCWGMLAEIYSKSVPPDEIRSKLIEAIKIEDLARVRPFRAIGILEHGSAEHACEELEQSVSEDPSNPETRLWLVEAMEATERWDQVREELAECLRLRPRWPAALRRRAKLRFREGEFAGAEEDWTEVSDALTGQQRLDDMAARGLGLSILGRFDDAIGFFDKVLVAGQVPEVAYNRAIAYARAKKTEPTAEDVSQLIAIFAESGSEVIRLYGEAGLSAVSGDDESAYAALQKAHDLDPTVVSDWATNDPAWIDHRRSAPFKLIMDRGVSPAP
jgi:tetratricopeptide (TPR) repeat protein